MDCYDEGKDNISSIARTTGLVTLGFVDEILNGNIPKGVFALKKYRISLD